MEAKTKTRTRNGDLPQFTITVQREVATLVEGTGDLPAPLAAAVECMADFHRVTDSAEDAREEYTFTIPAPMTGDGRDTSYTLTLEATRA